jgi:hypothetical protein
MERNGKGAEEVVDTVALVNNESYRRRLRYFRYSQTKEYVIMKRFKDNIQYLHREASGAQKETGAIRVITRIRQLYATCIIQCVLSIGTVPVFLSSTPGSKAEMSIQGGSWTLIYRSRSTQ